MAFLSSGNSMLLWEFANYHNVLRCDSQQIPTIMCYYHWTKRPLCQGFWHNSQALFKHKLSHVFTNHCNGIVKWQNTTRKHPGKCNLFWARKVLEFFKYYDHFSDTEYAGNSLYILNILHFRIQWLKELSQCFSNIDYILNTIGSKLCNIQEIFS